MTRKLAVFVALIALCGGAAASENEGCYNTFHKTKDSDCLETFLETVNKSAAGWAEQPQTMPGAVSGFLAELFSNYEEESQHILQEDVSADVADIYLMALFRAGLIDKAREYAEKNTIMDRFEAYQDLAVPTLKEVKPGINPFDNDLLLGAYAASGNTDHIAAILDNYTGVKDGMASDAFRISLVTSKFGPNLTPAGRENTMAPAACKKYRCKADPKKFQHVLTLASAFWATRALSRQDPAVKARMLEFFEEHPHLKKILVIEQNAFGNYIVMLNAYTKIKDNADINASLSIYENLGSAQNALNAIKRALKTQQTKQAQQPQQTQE